MNTNVESLILEQLKLIRSDVAQMDTRMSGLEQRMETRFDEIEAGQQALTGVLFGLGRSLNVLETRVEHIEQKLGIEE